MTRLLLTLVLWACINQAAMPLDWVDPRIGSGGEGFGIGSVPVGASVPFGMARPGPDTTSWLYEPWAHNGGYFYNDSFIWWYGLYLCIFFF
jgi:putative alpha-1,2-mannosidase